MSEALRNSMGEDSCLKPNLTELKLEPDTENHLDIHSAARKSDKIRQIVNEHTSAESQKTVESILEQVSNLSPLDKLLLYLKLPCGRAQDVDPLRQPLNPLGSRSEIQLTINWIKTHLEEDPQISLPKHEVYDEYIGYCTTNSVKPLSTADFGKVMKQVYPQVRPRRLGTRGNSRYCYAGLRKRLRLDSPLTPDIGTEGRKTEGCDSEEELNTASSFLIREWVEKLLQVKFDSLTDLACHLLDKMYVDNRSVAAFTIMSSGGRLNSTRNSLGSPQSAVGDTKHRDTQLQLQRKLQERQDESGGRMEKRKLGEDQGGPYANHLLSPHTTGALNKRSKVGEGEYPSSGGLGDYELPGENGQAQRYSVVVPNSQADHYVVNGGSNLVAQESFETGPQDFSNYPSERLELSGSPLSLIQTTSVGLRGGSMSRDKILPRKKQALAEAAANLSLQPGIVCLEPPLLLTGHTSVIKAGEKPKNKYKEAAEVDGWGENCTELVEVKGEMGWNEGGLNYDEPADLTTLGRVNSWDKSVLGNHSGGNSSDNQEEELVRYFTEPAEPAEDNKSEKLSQLRQLLEKQLKSPVGGTGAFKRTSLSMPMKQEAVTSTSFMTQAGGNLEPVLTTSCSALNLNSNLSSRRRVSFNPLIVSDPAAIVAPSAPPQSSSSQCPVPPSPGTRRRHFSFQPISDRQSLPQSPPASPFISPRSTPVHMLRSRHSSGSALPLHLLPGNGGGTGQSQGRQQHPSGSGSDISRAATFGSASESSTPFISPQGTPIPFNRSRHNSAQGRLCRSRHSSGLPGYPRYQTSMPYSPMALNNLNNPFSPQPSTPAQQPEEAPYQSSPQFVTPPEDPRSRHSSAGSDTGAGAPRSAPLSPFNSGVGSLGGSITGLGGRQRHQSAGTLPVATIHYRPPVWAQSNGDQSLQGEFALNTEVSSLLPESGGDRQYGYSQSQPATPHGDGAGMENSQYSNFNHNHVVQGQHHSQHSSYNNTPIPQEFGQEFNTGDGNDLEIGPLEDKLDQPNQKRKDNDDLDLALDALRDCDTDFSQFVQEVGGSNGQ